MTRRDILRVGGSGMLGLSLGGMLEMAAQAKETKVGGPGWGKAKSVILLYLQGGRAISTSGTPSPTRRPTSVPSLSPSRPSCPG